MPDFQNPHTYFLTNVCTSVLEWNCYLIDSQPHYDLQNVDIFKPREFMETRTYSVNYKTYLLVVMKSLSFPGHESECNVRCILLCVHPYVGPQLIYISKTWVYTIHDKIRREWEIKIITCCNNLLCKKQKTKKKRSTWAIISLFPLISALFTPTYPLRYHGRRESWELTAALPMFKLFEWLLSVYSTNLEESISEIAQI